MFFFEYFTSTTAVVALLFPGLLLLVVSPVSLNPRYLFARFLV